MMYGNKIRFIREMRGLTQENVASEIGIAQNAYSRIENNQTKLECLTLMSICKVLEVNPLDILSNQPAIINFQTEKGTPVIHETIELVITKQQEVYDKMLAHKDSEITRLNSILELFLNKKDKP